MATRAEMLAEAYRRGLLSPEKKAAYEEAMRRGLVQGGAQQPAAPAPKPPSPAQPVPQRPDRGQTAWDVANSFLAGAGESVQGMADMVAPPGVRRGLQAVAGVVHRGAEALGQATGNNALATAGRLAPRAGQYQTRTQAGQVARTAGQMAPGAAAPGSIAQRAANLVVPTITTEAAGRTAQAMGAGERGVQVARTVGGLAGGVAANVRAPVRPKPAPRTRAPSVDDLRTAKNAAYSAVDNAGVQYKPEATSRLVQTVREKLGEEIDPDLHSRLASVVKRRVEAIDGQPITLTKLDKIRQVINEDVLTPQSSKGERRLAYQLRDILDEFVGSASADDVLSAGDPGVAASTLKKARELNTRVAKIEAIQGAQARAANRAASTHSGGNINNATRQEVRKVAERGRNWTPAEKQALDQVVRGSKTQNVLRQVGKLSPQGNGLMLGGHILGGLKTGGASALVIPPAMIAKHVADGMTRGQVEKVIRMIASGREAQVAEMAARDKGVAGLLKDIRSLRLSSTGQILTSGGEGPNWLSQWPARQSGR